MSEKKTLERKETSAKNIIDLLGIPDSSSDEEANNVKAEEADQKDPQKSLASIIPVRYDEFLSNEDAKTTFKTVLKFYKKNMSVDCNWYFEKTPNELFETVGKMQLKGASMQPKVQTAFDQSCKFQRVGRQALAAAISHCETPILEKRWINCCIESFVSFPGLVLSEFFNISRCVVFVGTNTIEYSTFGAFRQTF